MGVDKEVLREVVAGDRTNQEQVAHYGQRLLDALKLCAPSRANSIAVTHAETALLWAEQSFRQP